LFKDYYNKNEVSSEKNTPVSNQQFTPGGFPGQRPPSGPPFRPPSGPPSGPQFRPPSGPPFGPPSGPPSGPPGQMRQPMGPPPSFTPELPSSERQEFQRGPAEFGTEFRGPGFPRRRPRDLRNCVNRFTFIWLVNGNSFWFFPIFVTREQVIGFRWRRGVWVSDRINIRRIFFHQCF